MADIRKLTDNLSVAPQISIEDVAQIAAAGFKAVMVNRPDGEEPGQVATADIEKAVTDAGMEFHNLPVVSGQMTPDHIARYGQVLSSAPAPLLAYCRTGTRSTLLWAMSQAGTVPGEQLIETAANAGYDISALAGRI